MSSWSHGYNVEQGYTYGAYKEMSPARLDFACRLAGFLPPAQDSDGGFRYLELGCGQGVGLCALAACCPGSQFVGVDFNPEHIAHARSLAAESGLSNVQFLEYDFSELARAWPAALGRFQYVALHGIYAWVPLEVRHAIVECLGHATDAGSLVYVSYNALPGWAATIPLQHILRQLQVKTASNGPETIRRGLALFESLDKAQGAVFRAYPGLRGRLESARSQNPAYLVQEYLHDNWHPLWFSEVAAELGVAKLSYVASATLPENYAMPLLPAASRAVAETVPEGTLRHELVDCAINQTFRRDIYCRGPRKAPRSAGAASVPLMSMAPAEAGPLLVKTSLGEVKLPAALHEPLSRQLANGPRTVAALLESGCFQQKTTLGAVLQAATLMLHAGRLGVAQLKSGSAAGFNSSIARMVASRNAPYSHLAAPRAGLAIDASAVDMLMLDAYVRDPKIDEAGLSTQLERGLLRLGKTLVKDGLPVESEADRRTQIDASVKRFVQRLPLWRSLGVID